MNTYLKTVSTSAGFLEESPVEFAPGLTCIIGARGTCKSTLIESIRFAFETNGQRTATLIQAEDGDERAPTYGIIKETLRAGSVRCDIIGYDSGGEVSLTLEREVGGESRIFVDGVREHTNREVLRGIEVFSQGDLQRIAEDDHDELRLALIDRPNQSQVAQLMRGRHSVADELRTIGPELRSIRAQLSTLRHQIAQLDGMKKELDELRKIAPAASPQLEAEREKFDQRQRILSEFQNLEEERVRLMEQLKEARYTSQSIGKLLVSLQEQSNLAIDYMPISALRAAVGELVALTDNLGNLSLKESIKLMNQRFDDESEVYYQLRQQEQEVNEFLKQQQALARQVEHLERQKAKFGEAQATESRLLDDREKLRNELERIDDELYELRVEEIDSINANHGETVQLTLGSSWNTRAYADRLSDLLSGSRIRSREEVAGSIAEYIKPSTLINLVETGDAQRLSELLNRDLGQMTRVVAHLGDHDNLYALETELPMSRLEITLYDEGQPKPVETLSKGQRATALLPIILRPLPYPLLFDQPEDDLDNKFIFQSLITTLRELKTQRQLIFVTHNANIPVLGGADHMVVMHMQSPTKAALPKVGTVEDRKQDILDLLEGGAEAFAERELHYHELLSENGMEGDRSSNLASEE